ncbi:hypothetical protein SUGI_0911230 [Cryptomeria japonica]|nr:hypothetical protein SUGI_0911230 [Cryptomeria japonica]
MGCSAGVLAVNMAKDLLLVNPDSVAADDEAYGCISVTEDDDGVYGVRLRPSLHTIAPNLTKLCPKVLPLREQLYYAYNWLCIKLLKMKVEAYVPNFKLAFQHFCVHPGARGVISGIGKSLKLNEYDLEASCMALFRFGNTSTSGVWYEMAYLHAKGRLKVGERVLQIALGSGVKCNTAVWEVVREKYPLESSCWDDCLHRYPCDTKKNYTDDFCDPRLSRVTPSIQPTSNDLDTNTI